MRPPTTRARRCRDRRCEPDPRSWVSTIVRTCGLRERGSSQNRVQLARSAPIAASARQRTQGIEIEDDDAAPFSGDESAPAQLTEGTGNGLARRTGPPGEL